MNVNIKDLIWIKGRNALAYGREGVVVVFGAGPQDPLPSEGDSVVVERSDGWLYLGQAQDIRGVGGGLAGFFIEGLTHDDLTLESRLRWGAELWPDSKTRATVRATA
jgi:hypothetical protein